MGQWEEISALREQLGQHDLTSTVKNSSPLLVPPASVSKKRKFDMGIAEAMYSKNKKSASVVAEDTDEEEL